MPAMMDKSIRATAALSTLLVFEAFAGLLFGLFLFGAVVRHAGWSGAVITALIIVLVFAWWRSFSLEVRDDVLSYRTLFSRRRDIRIGDIKSVSRKIELVSEGNRPPNRLEIHGVVAGQKVDFDINMKVFSQAQACHIEAVLKDRCSP